MGCQVVKSHPNSGGHITSLFCFLTFVCEIGNQAIKPEICVAFQLNLYFFLFCS